MMLKKMADLQPTETPLSARGRAAAAAAEEAKAAEWILTDRTPRHRQWRTKRNQIELTRELGSKNKKQMVDSELKQMVLQAR